MIIKANSGNTVGYYTYYLNTPEVKELVLNGKYFTNKQFKEGEVIMTYGFNIFTKVELDINEIAKDINLDKNKILVIENNDDWSRYNDNFILLIEYNGILNKGDSDKYIGCRYYDASTDDESIYIKFKNLDKKEIIIDME